MKSPAGRPYARSTVVVIVVVVETLPHLVPKLSPFGASYRPGRRTSSIQKRQFSRRGEGSLGLSTGRSLTWRRLFVLATCATRDLWLTTQARAVCQRLRGCNLEACAAQRRLRGSAGVSQGRIQGLAGSGQDWRSRPSPTVTLPPSSWSTPCPAPCLPSPPTTRCREHPPPLRRHFASRRSADTIDSQRRPQISAIRASSMVRS